ncbi:hypothetical protein ACEUZ9_002220 [Paracoccus litorisediminis]|uniref:hypothetical protein n=1 Tax=Paracoccus litorisediminis TaxID=2006130 RepID=UPI00373479A0
MGAREDLLAIPDELLRNGSIAQAVLVYMDFKDGPKRWWTGFGDLDVGGHRWEGIGDLIGMSPISASYTYSAQEMTFTVAATPEMLGLALAAKARVRDRAVIVYQQLFAVEAMAGFTPAGTEVMSGQPIGSPGSLFSGTMQKMPWSASGPSQRSLTVTAEGLFFRLNAPPRGRWTDADQKARYPGDKGCERLPIYAKGYETRWRD